MLLYGGILLGLFAVLLWVRHVEHQREVTAHREQLMALAARHEYSRQSHKHL